jgi:hypothetical protein
VPALFPTVTEQLASVIMVDEALAGDSGATVSTDSKSALIDMYRTDFFGRKTA